MSADLDSPPRMPPFQHYLLEFFAHFLAILLAALILFLALRSYAAWEFSRAAAEAEKRLNPPHPPEKKLP